MDGGSLLGDVLKYAEENAAEVRRVEAAFEAAGGDPADLDDLVYDVAGAYGADAANRVEDEGAQEAAIAAFEREAGEINNRGVRLQVAAVMMGNGIDEGERLVREAVGPVPAAK